MAENTDIITDTFSSLRGRIIYRGVITPVKVNESLLREDEWSVEALVKLRDKLRACADLESKRELASKPFERPLSLGCRLHEWMGREGATIGDDFAPLSFTFEFAGMYGGLIYHGGHDGGGDGGAPTFSVSLSPCDGWGMHT